MKPSELERLISLSQKTGDTLIITGSEVRESVVVMPVARYEALLDPVLKDESLVDSKENAKELKDQASSSYRDAEPPVLEDIIDRQEPIIQEKSTDIVDVPVDLPADNQQEASYDDEEERFYLEPVE